MTDKADQQARMLQYLLGALPSSERAELEAEYLTDTDLFHDLVALENELIDRYILGELSRAEQEKFEHAFLSDPARRQTVEIARSLLAYSAAGENVLSRTSPLVGESGHRSGIFRGWGVQVVGAAVFLVMTCGILWLVLNNHRLERELATLRQEHATATQATQALQQQVASLLADLQQRDSAIRQMAQLHDHDTASFSLGPGLIRGGNEAARLVIPARVSYVSLRVVIEDDSHARYSLSLRTVEGGLVWRSDDLRGRPIHDGNKEIVVTLPRSLLQNGDYVVRVSAGADDPLHALAGYSFHVTRR